MQTNPPKPHDPAAKAPPLMDEADIGSGEKTPGQRETEEIVRSVQPRHADEDDGDDAGGPADRG